MTPSCRLAVSSGASEPFTSNERFVILLPVFNDWAALQKLLPILDRISKEHDFSIQVLIVDDGCTVSPEEQFAGRGFVTFERIDVLRLRRNLGNQRAIAIGLAYLEEKVPCQAVVVMDSDGEDDPRDVPRLVKAYFEESRQKVVFAARTKRSERAIFRVFYLSFKALHYLLTNRPVRVGNFSVIPAARLASLVAVSEIWNHYAAAVYKSHQPVALVPTRRARRLDGRSKMNFTDLVIHGLSAISVYSDTVGVRLLVASTILIAFTLVGLACVLTVRILTDLAIPGWATVTAGILLIVLSQAIMFSCIFSFTILAGRQGSSFLPLRDYRCFVASVETVYQKRPDGVAQAAVGVVGGRHKAAFQTGVADP